MANVKAVDNHNRSVLHLAVEGDFSSILSVLLEHGANPDHADEEGNNGINCNKITSLLFATFPLISSSRCNAAGARELCQSLAH